MTDAVEVGDEFRVTGNPEIIYRVTAMDDHEALLRLIEHPHGVSEDDYFHDSVKNLASGRYTKIVPFFEVGKKYSYPHVNYPHVNYTVWTVHSIVEQDGAKAAATFMKVGEKVRWGIFSDFGAFREVTD